MPTRQYIGARYVPKFYTNSVDGSAQWESNVVYEPLTYVTLINGHMYISKKQVPATVGSPSENIKYWLDIGSYNGFIEELQAQIDALDEAKADNTTIGVLETIGAAPTKTYYLGGVFMATDGKMYIVTASSIESPAVLNNDAGGNCEEVTVSDKLNALNATVTENVEALENVEDFYVFSETKSVTVASDGTDTFITLFDKLLVAFYNEIQGETDKIVIDNLYEPTRGVFTVLWRGLYNANQLAPATFAHMHAYTMAFVAGTTFMQGMIDMRETGASHFIVLNHQIVNTTWGGTNLTNYTAEPYTLGEKLTLEYRTARKIVR